MKVRVLTLRVSCMLAAVACVTTNGARDPKESVAAGEACIDQKGSWRCDNGAAKGTGPCSAEAMFLLNCVLRNLDGGTDAGRASDGG